ncbi:MAG: S8 family serine peptidase, partial [Acidimicrobiia bacterium]|nr:S8 family serine peptidase [Acidimicrobiia bacterium]
PVLESFVRFNGVSDTLETIARLNQAGIYAQPNHVLFAHSSPGDFQANPFYANPFYANPFYANPFYANPFYANPNPAADPSIRETGRRPSSARPAEQREFKTAVAPGKPVIAILDTGYAQIAKAGVAEDNKICEALAPKNLVFDESTIEIPDADHAGYLDPVAGHGTFIAGIIEQLTPGCKIEVHKILESYGDGDEVEVGKKLLELASRGAENEHLIVNLSFGGYSSTGMGALAETIAELHHTGATIVASAGNDGTSIPMYPAAIPNVVAVGALDHEGAPAPFSNYGPWVRACTLGVEIVSTFFTFNGKHPVQGEVRVDEFEGWAVWSGTSFAAPRVVAKLAGMIQAKPDLSGHDAVKELLESSGKDRKALLGTVVNI